MNREIKIIFVGLSLIIPHLLWASGEGTTSGSILLEPSSARLTALGEAFTGASNDLSAMALNPAALKSLHEKQASFIYQKGLFNDSYGNFMFGLPSKDEALGFSLSYYDAGTIDLYNGTSDTSLIAKKDLAISVGCATQTGKLSTGLSGKYISSEVLGQKASAMALDVGLQLNTMKGLNFGAALQNIGTTLKYAHEENSLPRVARVGMAWTFLQKTNSTIFLDSSYFLNESKIKPGLGLETFVGPLALRAGYKGGNSQENFSLGAGFNLGQATLDYSFGLAKDLNSQHRASVAFHFL